MDSLDRRFPGCSFVEDLAERQLDVYRRQPKELIANFNRERSAADSYRGRQLLELLQNADDAGREVASGVEVLLRLQDDFLVVANTGEPFTRDGIESLVVSDVSPKQLEQQFIGEKGLGFRSVLTWSSSPLVASGDHVVAFDPGRARKASESLASEDEAVRTTLRRWREREHDTAHPAATLRFPYVPDPTDERLVCAVDLLDAGYDTAVVLPLRSIGSDREIKKSVESQLETVSAETLLFCRHISRLMVDAHVSRNWSVLREDQGVHVDVVVHEDGVDDPLLWRLYRETGELPTDLRQDESGVRTSATYSLAVAAPDSLDQVDPRDHRLSVYFPTDDRLPCPLVAHASLSTDDSRKRLTDHEANRYVLRELADLMARVAEQEAATVGPQRGLRLLSGVEAADPELQRLGLVEEVLGRIRERRVFPRRAGGVTTGSGVLRPPEDVWLEEGLPEAFPEILDIVPGADFRPLVDRVDLDWYENDELAARCSEQVQHLAPMEAGRFVGRIIADKAIPRHPLPELLVGADGNLLPVSHTAFLPGGALEGDLPAWVQRFSFLDEDFAEGLRDGLQITSTRELYNQLDRAGFQVEEFRLEGVARHLKREYRRAARDSTDDELQRARDVLGFLFGAAEWDRRRTTSLEDVAVDVVTDQGALRPAGECYLGDGYPSGRLVHQLYGSLGQDEFVAGAEELGLPERPTEVERFLVWLGAADAPRYRPLQKPTRRWEREFAEYVLRSLAYPQQLAEKTYSCADDAVEELDVTFSELSLPERFEELLQEAPPEAIVAFLSGEGGRHRNSDSDGKLRAMQGSQRVYRDAPTVQVPDPCHFLLRKKAWIPSEDGEHHAPERVMLQEAGLRLFDQLFHRPGIDPDHELLARRGGQSTVRSVLASLGAVLSVGSLEGDQLYRLLLDLPHHSPDGEQARRVYRQLAEAPEVDTSSPLREVFLEEGRMWGRLGEEDGYFPVSQLRYADSGAVPSPVRDRVPLASLPSGSGAKKVGNIFGVTALRSSDYAIEVDDERTDRRAWSERARAKLERAVPFLYASRLAHTADDGGRQRRALQRAELHVCNRVFAEISVLGDEAEEVTVSEDLEGLLAGDDMYLVSSRPSWTEEELFASELGRDAIAGLLSDQVEVATAQSDFARILACGSDSEKRTLLDRMTSGQAEDRLSEARERLEIEEEPDAIEFSPPRDGSSDEADEEEQAETTPVDEEDRGAAESDAEEARPDRTPEETDDEQDGESDSPEGGGDRAMVEVVSELLSEPSFRQAPAPGRRPGGSREQVVRSGDSGGGGGGGGSRTDPKVTEELALRVAMVFEERAGRHPLKVDHLQGWEGPGCDLVSFDTEEAMEEAVATERMVPAEVGRYIEVKGTTSPTASVELTPNEHDRAEELGERYFLYRVHVSSGGEPRVQLAVLRGPAGSKAETISRSYSYDLTEEPQTEWYSLESPSPG